MNSGSLWGVFVGGKLGVDDWQGGGTVGLFEGDVY